MTQSNAKKKPGRPRLTADEKALRAIKRKAANSIETLTGRQTGLNRFLGAVGIDTRVQMQPGRRAVVNSMGEVIELRPGIEAAAQGSIMSAPSAVSFYDKAADTIEASMAEVMQRGLSVLHLGTSTARAVMTPFLEGAWNETDLEQPEGRETALIGDNARKLPSPLRVPYGREWAEAMVEHGPEAARQIRQDLLNIPAALVLGVKIPLEGETLAERIEAAGLPIELGMLHKSVLSRGLLTPETAGRIAQIIRIARSGNRWPSTGGAQERALSLLLPALSLPEPGQYFHRWLVLGLTADLNNVMPDAGLKVTIWAGSKAGVWRVGTSFEVAQCEAARMFAALGRAAGKKVIETAELRAPFMAAGMFKPVTRLEDKLMVQAAGCWADLISAGADLRCCIGGKPYRDLCARLDLAVALIHEVNIEKLGEEAEKVVPGKVVAACLHRGAVEIEFRSFANGLPKPAHRRALADYFTRNVEAL
jgi:hypothetical protein